VPSYCCCTIRIFKSLTASNSTSVKIFTRNEVCSLLTLRRDPRVNSMSLASVKGRDATKSFKLKDALCCVYYRPYKLDENESSKRLTLVTNSQKSSARQFMDWLNEEALAGRIYNIIAHNGSRFDFYFLLAAMSELELLDCSLSMRGTAVIGINYRSCLFKDSCCFLTDKLENLCNSFKVGDMSKVTSMELHGKTISSSQLCFYRPELDFDGFLALNDSRWCCMP
jgi:hypothetical protein